MDEEEALAVLLAHRCFEPEDAGGTRWRLDATQPGLRRAVADRQLTAVPDMEIVLGDLLRESDDLLVTVGYIDRELVVLTEQVSAAGKKMLAR